MVANLFFLFFFVCCGSLVIHSFILGISPMPSSKKARDKMIELLPETIENGTIYELGSGWGTLAFLLAKSYPNVKVIALERSPVPYFFSRLRQFLLRKPNLVILRKNFYKQNLSDARAIVCYLFPEGMKKLSVKLKRQPPSQCTLVSNTFSLPEWDNNIPFFLNDLAAARIYRYKWY